MWNRIRNLLAPPLFDGDEEKTNAARLINTFLIFGVLAAVLFPLIAWLANSPVESRTLLLIAALGLFSLLAKFLLQRGAVQASGGILTATWWVLFSLGMYAYGGLHDTAITGIIFLLILASAVGGRRVLFTASGLATLSLVVVYLAENQGWIQPAIEIPSPAIDVILPVLVIALATFFLRNIVGHLTEAYQDARQQAVGMRMINQELQASRDDLAAQTTNLERRTRYLAATAAVARDAAAELDFNILLRRSATLISEQFDFYHTGIFLLDPSGDYAVLQAASSEGGKRMLARQHRLTVGQEGLVGNVASSGQARIALDVGEDAAFFDNPDLPKTRSEAALPLRVRENIIGVLDVQSTASQAFDQEDVAVLQTLADQIAVAIQTARLYQQAQESLAAQRRAYGEISQQSWRQMINTRQQRGYQFTGGKIIPLEADTPTNGHALPNIEIPIQLGGQVIGTLKAHKADPQANWTEDEAELLSGLTEQLSVALESARLYQDTQRRAAQEQITGQITARIRETLDIESILKTASEQIRVALDLPEVVIRLGDPTTSETGPRS